MIALARFPNAWRSTVLTLITRGKEHYASAPAGNRPCVALAGVAPAPASASAAKASFQVQEVLLMCSARDRALCDLSGANQIRLLAPQPTKSAKAKE